MSLQLKCAIKTNEERTLVPVGDVLVGQQLLIAAGPCSVESRQQIIRIAAAVKAGGANLLRGGVFKPRTSPYSFQGLQEQGLEYLVAAREETGIPFVTEVVDTRQVELVARYADVLQIGARNCQNYALLKEVGKLDIPVILKRGFATTIEEYLCSAEYILQEGNRKVILCERGIRSIEQYTKFTFDINAIPVLKDLTHLPVIADPSHATGVGKYVPNVALAAIAAGADGLMIEVHNDGAHALSDAQQQLNFREFGDMMQKVKAIASLANA